MTERMHPEDLRALVAAKWATCGYDPEDAIERADSLLDELARTAKSAPVQHPIIQGTEAVTKEIYKMRAEVAEARLQEWLSMAHEAGILGNELPRVKLQLYRLAQRTWKACSACMFGGRKISVDVTSSCADADFRDHNEGTGKEVSLG
jgi:hypothetical protein